MKYNLSELLFVSQFFSHATERISNSVGCGAVSTCAFKVEFLQESELFKLEVLTHQNVIIENEGSLKLTLNELRETVF